MGIDVVFSAGGTDITIREMRTDDYDEVCELWRKTQGMCLSNADRKENIQKFLARNSGLSLVCCHGNKIVGVVLCGHDGRRGHLYHVAVAEEYRGKGIGRKLVEICLGKLRAEGIDKCHIFVYPGNDIGNAFWKSAGWEKRDDIYVYSKSV